MGPNGAGTPWAKATRLVSSEPVWTPYHILRGRSSAYSISPPFPALLKRAGKTDTIGRSCRLGARQTLQSARNFLILSRRVAGVHNLHSATRGQEKEKPELRQRREPSADFGH
jgi:hypothetical protein